MNFSPESAIQYLKDKSREFFRQRAILADQLEVSEKLKREAVKNNDQPAV